MPRCSGDKGSSHKVRIWWDADLLQIDLDTCLHCEPKGFLILTLGPTKEKKIWSAWGLILDEISTCHWISGSALIYQNYFKLPCNTYQIVTSACEAHSWTQNGRKQLSTGLQQRYDVLYLQQPCCNTQSIWYSTLAPWWQPCSWLRRGLSGSASMRVALAMIGSRQEQHCSNFGSS